MSHQYLPKPRRNSRSVPSSSSTKEQQQPVRSLPSYAADSPYTPFLQPKGAYAYKIALPSRPQPGQTPWPGQLPPVVGPAAAAALGEATNRPRHSSHHGHVRTTSMSAPAPAQVTGPLVAPRPHVSRSTSMMARVPAPQPALQPVPAHSTGQQQVWANGLNPLLGPGGGLLWTLRSPVSYIKTRTSSLATPGPLTYAHRALPIQSSRTPIVVVIPLPGAPIRIQVETVGALVDMLSDVLRVQANAVQWAAADQRSVTTAYRARCGADATELAKGVRRVDLLGLNAAFAGLVPVMSPTGAREWVLRVVVAA